MTTVELLVRDTPCADHPDEEWIEFCIGGNVVFAMCTGAFKAFARMMRGKDMLAVGKHHQCVIPEQSLERIEALENTLALLLARATTLERINADERLKRHWKGKV